jgi:biotin-[acetyl-CoA-carboxylase] ligase BirA-like protein
MSLADLLRKFDPSRSLPYKNRILATSCESTNDLGKLIARSSRDPKASTEPWLLVALEQTKGKGRLGNDWHSPAGGIYVSIVLPAFPTEDILSLPLLTGVGICQSLETMISAPCKLKWPNDVLVGGEKIAGVLIETVARSKDFCHVVIGFGVNYGLAPESARYPTTSIAVKSADPPSLPATARSLVSAVSDELTRSDDLRYAVESLKRLSIHTVGDHLTCRTTDGSVIGRFIGFDSRGFLRLEYDHSELIVSSAELVSPGGETRG